jgi:hypothetical protein
MDGNAITTELKKYQPTDATIASWEKYLTLTIEDLEDKEAFQKVHEARMIVREGRIQVEKIRKDLKADALEYGRRVDGEAKRLFKMIEPIEEHLKAEEQKIEDEKERIRVMHEQAEKKRLEDRVNILLKSGMAYNPLSPPENTEYLFLDFKISLDEIKNISDEGFAKFAEDVSKAKKIEDARIAEEEKKKKEEAEALEAKAAELKAREEALEKKEADAKKAEEIKEATDKATKETEERLKKEAERKALAEAEAKRIADEKANKNKKYLAFLEKNGASKEEIEAGDFLIDRDGTQFRLYKLVDIIDIK